MVVAQVGVPSSLPSAPPWWLLSRLLPSTTLLGPVANPPGPLPAQLTPGPTVKNTLSSSSSPQPPPQPPPPPPLNPSPHLARFFSTGATRFFNRCHTPYLWHLLRGLKVCCSRMPHGLQSGPQMLHTPVSAGAALAPSAASSQATVTPSKVPPASSQAKRSGLDAGHAARYP